LSCAKSGKNYSTGKSGMHLVLLETSGNQNYIFSTNKLKENIGASELTYLAGTKWVLDAIAAVNNTPQLSLWTESSNQELRKKLLNPELNKPIMDSENTSAEVIIATSGKALILVKTKKEAQQIIQQVTYRALSLAPGLDICGVISKKFNWDERSLGEVNREVHEKFTQVRAGRPAPDLRFLRLPVVDQCATSGLPASKIDDTEDESVASAVSLSKRHYSEEGLARIRKLLPGVKLPRNTRELNEELEKEGTWLSVIHADGNGLGEIFLNFDRHIQSSAQSCAEFNRNYVDKLRRFSIALDQCTEKAFQSAIQIFKPKDQGFSAIIPLVLGGDDLTVLCDGRNSLEFTELFLRNFEQATAHGSIEGGIIPEIASIALQVGRLSACAGVAIIKPKFPFSVAYDLSEKLMQSAKQVKKKITHIQTNQPYPCSALDFHILYDSSNVEFDSIRKKLELQSQVEKIRLHNRPYVTTSIDELKEANNQDWAEFHQLSNLKAKIDILIQGENDDGGVLNYLGHRKLPNSQMHDLRAGLFLGKSVADARYKLIRDRYRDQGIVSLAGSEDSLFQQEPNSELYTTGLLDALDAAEFLHGGKQSGDQY